MSVHVWPNPSAGSLGGVLPHAVALAGSELVVVVVVVVVLLLQLLLMIIIVLITIIVYMRNLLGWLETRLARISLIYPNVA